MDLSVAIAVAAYAAVISFLLYVNFWPTVLAFRKRHRSRWVILILNALVGWTAIGWIVILIWVLRAPSTEQSAAFLGADTMKIPPHENEPTA